MRFPIVLNAEGIAIVLAVISVVCTVIGYGAELIMKLIG